MKYYWVYCCIRSILCRNLKYVYILVCITTEEIHLLKEQQLESATLALKEEKHSIDVSYFMNAAQTQSTNYD